MTETMSHKQRTRARILDEAARAMREHGSEGIGVAALMKRAGLTHGGFYAHFENRDDLVAHAVTRMFEDSRAMLDRHLDGKGPAEGLATLIDDYLSESKIDLAARGCPMPPLLGEVSRMPVAARERFEAGIEAFRNRLEKAITALGVSDPGGAATSAMAEMIGAATTARALGRGEAATRLLQTSREQIKQRLGLSGD